MRKLKQTESQSVRWRKTLVFGLILPVTLFSDDSHAATTLNITGTLITSPSCVINGNKVIEVNFGNNLVTTRVDGSHYMKTLDYQVTCRNITTNALQMQFRGVATGFNPNALQTGQADLGIALSVNGQPLAINSWLKFTYPNKPLLQAVPVKRPDGVLKPGDFRAAATLIVAYQ
ncbi:fimbrial protein [Serratia proteamaculans]|uniref:fimbrial protein n=1 Tax=Serratia proteamaculans TaxID=28151 RepID=UPI00217A8577|nr:fimbrial protein [Serratia proteamaculans]CAI1920265.1 putative minor fimbrial subunit StfF [Serratia proteamaculans]CAI2430675.1 putative minor fimbrial subunit StfF [Serratia proteamaculans]